MDRYITEMVIVIDKNRDRSLSGFLIGIHPLTVAQFNWYVVKYVLKVWHRFIGNRNGTGIDCLFLYIEIVYL